MIAMDENDPSHITEFASERYFSKLRQLNEPAEGAAAAARSAVTPSTSAVFTLPLRSPIGRETFPKTEKGPAFSSAFRALRTRRQLGTKTVTSSSDTSLVNESFDAIETR